MLNRKFVRCRKCNAVHPVTAFDKAPRYTSLASAVSETTANDWNDFMTSHAGHRLEALEATGQSLFPNRPSSDPMAVGYIEATNGKETVLLRRVRSSIQEPLCYEVVPGRLIFRESTLEIQENTLRKEMKLHFSWAPAEPLSDEKIDLFVKLYRQVVSGLDVSTLCIREFGDSDDMIAYEPLNARVRSILLDECQRWFTADVLIALRRFIDSHGDADDVLALVVRRAVAVEKCI